MSAENFVYWLTGVLDRCEGAPDENTCNVIRTKLREMNTSKTAKPLYPLLPTAACSEKQLYC